MKMKNLVDNAIGNYPQKCFHFLFLILIIFIFSLFSGCGYAIHKKSELPFDTIHITKIENKTLEPKLQDRLYNEITSEFLKQGISVQKNAGYKLDGTVKKFDLKVLSEKSDVAVEYEVTIIGDFKLIDPDGKTKEFKNIGSPFIVSFPGTGLLNELIANKESITEKAVKDMAADVVAAIIYR
jgi:hypothetical protein